LITLYAILYLTRLDGIGLGDIARIGQRWEDLIMTIWPENPAEYASWVQAIGSVAAVVVTLIVMFCQF